TECFLALVLAGFPSGVPLPSPSLSSHLVDSVIHKSLVQNPNLGWVQNTNVAKVQNTNLEQPLMARGKHCPRASGRRGYTGRVLPQAVGNAQAARYFRLSLSCSARTRLSECPTLAMQ